MISLESALRLGGDARVPLIGTVIFFLIFVLNVGLGSMTGFVFLSDVGEMLVLLVTTILFVVTILQKEAAAKK